MPFQDIDEVSPAEPQRTPGGLERALRKIFIEDWNLKLLSLAITFVLWLVVTGQNTPVTTHVDVQLNFIRPPWLEISNDPPKTVDVMLTGSRRKLDNLSSLDLVATVDITDQRVGERVIRLADKAQISLPQGVRINGFQPSAIPIRLEMIIERQLEIEAKLEGKPAEGYELYGSKLNKSTVTIRGPASHVNALQKAPTETIWLTGHKESFSASNIAIDIQDPKVDLLDPVVNVDIDIGERRVEKSFTDVPVVAPEGLKAEPSKATLSLLGPASALEELQREDIKLVLDQTGDSFQPRLELPAAFQGKVVLKSIKATSLCARSSEMKMNPCVIIR
jgi:YbbR domain-containing protein